MVHKLRVLNISEAKRLAMMDGLFPFEKGETYGFAKLDRENITRFRDKSTGRDPENSRMPRPPHEMSAAIRQECARKPLSSYADQAQDPAAVEAQESPNAEANILRLIRSGREGTCRTGAYKAAANPSYPSESLF